MQSNQPVVCWQMKVHGFHVPRLPEKIHSRYAEIISSIMDDLVSVSEKYYHKILLGMGQLKLSNLHMKTNCHKLISETF